MIMDYYNFGIFAYQGDGEKSNGDSFCLIKSFFSQVIL